MVYKKKPVLEVLKLDNCKSESGFMFLQQKRNHLKLTASFETQKGKSLLVIKIIFPRSDLILAIICISIIKWLTHYMQTRQSLSTIRLISHQSFMTLGIHCLPLLCDKHEYSIKLGLCRPRWNCCFYISNWLVQI